MRNIWTHLGLVPHVVGLAAFVSIALFPSLGLAFCRTTTCDGSKECPVSGGQNGRPCCKRFGCDDLGLPLYWPSSCVSYNIQEAGSKKLEISAETLSTLVDRAFSRWVGADCEGASISLSVEARGQASCGAPEFNENDDAGNANIWMFRDTGEISQAEDKQIVGVPSSALAVTTISFNDKTGAILDVDVELNSGSVKFTTTDEVGEIEFDLESVVTHEAGHFLGLGHSSTREAVMFSRYNPGSIDSRELGRDDIEGICAVYPTDREIPPLEATCEPRGGYATECYDAGCACRVGKGPDSPGGSKEALLLGAILCILVTRRRVKSYDRAT